MSSWPSSDDFGATVTLLAPEGQTGQSLVSSSSTYSVLEFIGEGCFAKVAKCQNLATKELVAIKILKDSAYTKKIVKEVSMLKILNGRNPDHSNVVKFFEQFQHLGQTCLAFEMLDSNLYDLIEQQACRPLSVHQLRPITKQLMLALDALKGLGILHTDIKPDNVMCVNKKDQPLRVKLIDFGEAIPACQVQTGTMLQPCGYRAPEVALGLPFNEAIDAWGAGCVLAYLYLADNLFPVDCEYQMIKCMVQLLGQPEDRLLMAGGYSHYFFCVEQTADGPTLRLMTPIEYAAADNMKPKERHSFFELPSSLYGLVNIYPIKEAAEFVDRMAFLDLIGQLLHLDGDQRISPCQALQHPFITMSHLRQQLYSRAYLTTSCAMMNICSMEDLADMVNNSAIGGQTSTFIDPPATGSIATGIYEDGPSTAPSDEATVIFSNYNNPAAWSSDGGKPLHTYDKDPAEWWSDQGLANHSYEEDLAVPSSDGEHLSYSYDQDTTVWSVDGAQGIYEGAPASSTPDRRPLYHTCEKDVDVWTMEGEISPCTNDEDPVPSILKVLW